MLSNIIPFRYLEKDTRKALEADMSEFTYEKGDALIRQGDTKDDRIFILKEGSVEIFDPASGLDERIGLISAGHYFGERSALFGEPRKVDVRAREKVRAYCMDGERFLKLIDQSKPFAQALGKILRDKQGIFVAFDRFRAEVVSSVSRGEIDLDQLLPMYRALKPALHGHVDDPDQIDFSGLAYAVHRLPENLTRTFTYFLTEMLPYHYSAPDQTFLQVPTKARRRGVYEMLPGKNMVLIRDGLSDLIDFVSCLCLYSIEARKIRHQLRDPALLRVMRETALEDLPLSPKEVAGLKNIWPEDTVARLHEIALHHEDIRIEVFKDLHNYNSAHSEAWSDQLAAVTRELMGCEPADLPQDLPVHIISSNTHSVLNCLSPWMTEKSNEILAWAKENKHELLEENWQTEADLVYALARDYLRQYPEMKEAKLQADREAGIARMKETAFTGIGVQLIDTGRLAGKRVDPGVTGFDGAQRALIVNIDYAFGQQAEHIVANLLALFGPQVASVNVLGKAGGLMGKRGDIMAPSAFIDQTGDRFLPLPEANVKMDLERLRKMLPERTVHHGSVLTVAGTLLQNRVMLEYNRHIWGCVGLEMEGSYYFAQILESLQRGVVPESLALRFLYYTSDLPLDHDSNLSRKMRASEGVPALYAVTREILCGIFEQQNKGRKN